MEDRVIKLETPIEFGKGETVSELTFRRARLGDLKGVNVEQITSDAILLVASRLCGKPVGVIERLDEDDAGKVVRLVLDFFRKSLGTGGVV